MTLNPKKLDQLKAELKKITPANYNMESARLASKFGITPEDRGRQ